MNRNMHDVCGLCASKCHRLERSGTAVFHRRTEHLPGENLVAKRHGIPRSSPVSWPSGLCEEIKVGHQERRDGIAAFCLTASEVCVTRPVVRHQVRARALLPNRAKE